MAGRAPGHRRLLATALSLSVTACARSVPATASAGTATCEAARPAIVDPARDGAPASPRDPWLVIESGGCYGPCPVYRVEVDGAGALQFAGSRYTAARGEHRRRLDPNERAEVERVLARLHCLPNFDAVEATDHPRLIVTYTFRGRRFRYLHESSDSSAPPEGRTLELALISALGIRSWAASDPSWEADLSAEFEEREARERAEVRALEVRLEAEETRSAGD